MTTSDIQNQLQSVAQLDHATDVPVIDYEGSQYKSDFWLGQGRGYEDATERRALKRLLPPHGGRIAEIGAGFGRLADLYGGYEQVILFDYSRTLLQDAVAKWGNDPRFIFVAGNIYEMPLATGVLDSLVMVRVMHHLADVSLALQQLARILHRHGVAVLEYANKRNLKALLRWTMGRQPWSPLALEPLEFVKLNFDFHPIWMQTQFSNAKLVVKEQYAVSHFRLPLLKRFMGAEQLAQLDEWLFVAGGRYPLAPSVFVQARANLDQPRVTLSNDPAALAKLFRCPHCSAEAFSFVSSSQLVCGSCNHNYAKQNGIWDFKEVVN